MLNPTDPQVDKPFNLSSYFFRMVLIFVVALYVYEAMYCLISEVSDGTGLWGHFIGLQLIVFFGHTFAPLNWLCVFLFGAIHLLGGIFLVAAVAEDRSEPHRLLSALMLAVPLVASSLTAYGIEAWSEQRDLDAPVRQVDLDARSSAPAPRNGVVELSGWADPNDAVGYSYSLPGKVHDIDASFSFVPVVPKTWTHESPVRYFARQHGEANHSSEPLVQDTESGELTGGLPWYVAWQLKAKHIKIDPSYVVIDWRQMEKHHLVDQKERDVVLGIGLLWSLPAAIGIFMFYAVARGRQGGNR